MFVVFSILEGLANKPKSVQELGRSYRSAVKLICMPLDVGVTSLRILFTRKCLHSGWRDV
jgi:hypothetical protein